MTWWKAFSQRQDKPANQQQQQQQQQPQQSFKSPARTQAPRKVFGAPLSKVLDYAGQGISVNAPDGSTYIWGDIPIVVGKCGAYLKQKTDIEGLFRVSGSEKRMRDLQATFDEAPTYGGDLDWPHTSYSPHDIATIFRRYLTQMPEPVVPHAFYDKFRNASIHELDHAKKLKEYKRIIRQMPKPNRALLLYVLDLLGTTAHVADKNLMTAGNLAVIFQPGILHHPEHDLRPRENALSKDVLEFLIENQQSIVQSLTAPAEVLLTPPQETPGPAVVQPLVSRPKPVQRGDSGYMLPSDSDDEPPPGGYVIIESRGSSRRERPVHLKPPTQTSSSKPSIELLDPSDSDEEAPAGGYVVFENNRGGASGKRTPLGLNLARPRTTTPTSGHAHASTSSPHATGERHGAGLSRSRTALQPADARTNSPKPEGGAMGLLRRRTLPTKRVSDFTARVRRAVREA
ncbi:hypothetical protein VHUM_00107 [Vanrija humicola]|uniref:Rho-GAP domain-containing protein n=1 Tax=Vanrija humicola TaxID=5417 RepID=A0A7D8Z799_VANHU|nr:hypothetical protein VHUM_00107 [Vanrija humicola]